ncbi:HAAS signaling domain-containing protein [Streptomyces shenzhenensis]|uniref:HAAS signaling domain-containing protein n=1 Tax=Streptomyces shenzhenensis TaxID=943815 RepID=UPI0036C3AF54
MTDTRTHPLVRAYLSSVDQRAGTLPKARREELLADLSEHIEASLADADHSDDAAVSRVLDQLGDPGAIADAALAEEPGGPAGPQPESRARTHVTLALVVLAFPLTLVPVIGILGLAAAVAGLWRIWKSPQWTRPEKVRATALMLAPLITVPALGLVFTLANNGLGSAELITTLLLSWCAPAAAAIALSRTASRLRETTAGSRG